MDNAELAELDRRRRQAKKHPLTPGLVLSSRTPSLVPDVFPARQAPSDDHPRRVVDWQLVERLQEADQAFDLVLKEPLATGKSLWSQVWRADVRIGDETHSIVLKLYMEALFPPPLATVGRRWRRAEVNALSEADSYTAFAPLQGFVVPMCYGFYRFDHLPAGESAIGVLLEDLSPVSSTLPAWLAEQRRLKRRQRRRQQLDARGNVPDSSGADSSDVDSTAEEELFEFEQIEPLICSIFDNFRELHRCNRATFAPYASDFLIAGLDPAQAEVITLGFSATQSKQEWEAEDTAACERVRRKHNRSEDKSDWRRADTYALEGELGHHAFGLDLMDRWEQKWAKHYRA
ncbi:hypothetical protein JCM10207_008433 [Rhodosporidiobolus poonsookiae]